MPKYSVRISIFGLALGFIAGAKLTEMFIYG